MRENLKLRPGEAEKLTEQLEQGKDLSKSVENFPVKSVEKFPVKL
jgi:hypothetical protein